MLITTQGWRLGALNASDLLTSGGCAKKAPINQTLAQALPYIIPLLVLALLWRRITRTRKVRIEFLWIAPAIAAVGAGVLIANEPPPTMLGIVVQAAAFLFGAGLGWQRGAFTRLTVDPETHEVTSKASAAGVVLILAAFAIRSLLRAGLSGPSGYASQLHVSATLATDAFLLFAIGMVITQRLEIWLRCRKLLAAARAAKEAALS